MVKTRNRTAKIYCASCGGLLVEALAGAWAFCPRCRVWSRAKAKGGVKYAKAR